MARITLLENDHLRFEVEDDGRGFAVRGTRGRGIDNMRDRIVALGGRLTIDSSQGEGTRVIGTVPVGLTELTPDVERLFQRATDALDDCFAIYRAVRDSNGAVVDFTVEHLNDAACRYSGRPREAQVGRTLGYLDPEFFDSNLFAWQRAALDADGPSSLDEASYERGTDERRLQNAYELRAVPLGSGRLAVTWREITERKRHEDELLLQSAVLDRVAEGICLFRASDGLLLYSNPSFDRLFGHKPGELLGAHVSELGWSPELDERSGAWVEGRITAFEHPDHGKLLVASFGGLATASKTWGHPRAYRGSLG
jgi:PAS domain-containing protein